MVTKKKKPDEEIEETDDKPTLLTAQLDNSISPDSQIGMESGINIKEIYTEIDNILMSSNYKKKSNLIGDNVKGIIIANWFNSYLERTLGYEFRLNILDELIIDKMTYIISLDKTGMTELLKGIASLSPQITSIMPPTLVEKLSGIPAQQPNQRVR